jgi:hypothetical protein
MSVRLESCTKEDNTHIHRGEEMEIDKLSELHIFKEFKTEKEINESVRLDESGRIYISYAHFYCKLPAVFSGMTLGRLKILLLVKNGHAPSLYTLCKEVIADSVETSRKLGALRLPTAIKQDLCEGMKPLVPDDYYQQSQTFKSWYHPEHFETIAWRSLARGQYYVYNRTEMMRSYKARLSRIQFGESVKRILINADINFLLTRAVIITRDQRKRVLYQLLHHSFVTLLKDIGDERPEIVMYHETPCCGCVYFFVSGQLSIPRSCWDGLVINNGEDFISLIQWDREMKRLIPLNCSLRMLSINRQFLPNQLIT